MNNISFVFRNEIKTIDFENSEYTPNTTLLEFIRSNENTKGTKEGCNEGDCGACTVVIVEQTKEGIKYRAVNSCVMFLASVHGKQVITIEDLGTVENLHPIQQIFVDEHASQCGFCTPGFIMSLFAQKAQKNDSSKDELVEAMTGNLCRCTGYRPIVSSAEDLSKVKDLKDFDKFYKKDLLKNIDTKNYIEIHKNNYDYFLPFSLNDALILKSDFPDYIVTSGGTDLVLKVTKRKEAIFNIIDISSVFDIEGIEETENNYTIGAGTKIEDIYQFSKDKIPALAEMLSLFGAKQIRNRASIGGNIATASPIGDFMPVLFALDVKLELSSVDNKREVPIEEFVNGYRTTVLAKNELITKIIIPKNTDNRIIKSFKVSKRMNLDISTVSAGFMFLIENNFIKEIKLAYGGMAEMTKRALKTEKFLIAKEFSETNILEASKILEQEFKPITDARSSDIARKIMAKNLLIKFYEDFKIS